VTLLRAAIACVALLIAPSAIAQPPLWTVRTPHATLILFGSIHLLPPGLDWEPPALAAALARANEVWFELPIDDLTDGEAGRLAQDRGLLPKGDSLFNHLSAREMTRLSNAGIRVNIPAKFLAPMRPWLAEVTLSLAQDGQAGAIAGQGVEQQISLQAPPAAHRRAFETAGQQIAFLASAPMADQVASLDETLGEIIDDPGLYQRVVRTWLDGDLAGLQKDALDPLAKASPRLYRRLITDRNRRWSGILARRLEGSGVIVVVVGTGHLVGPRGLPALLRAKGLTVQGPGQPTGPEASAAPAAH
jgi:hypothetical protein